MTGPYEAELNRIRGLEDWRIPKATSLQTALTSLVSALGKVLESSAWEGSSFDAARGSLGKLQQNFRILETYVGQLSDNIENANAYRRNAAAAELPSTRVDPFWANAAKVGSVVVHPVLGPLAADKALDVIGSFLGNKREEEAKRIVQQIEQGLTPSAESLKRASATLANFDPRVAVPTPPQKPVDPGTDVTAPHITYPGGGSSPGGSIPGGGSHPGSVSPPAAPGGGQIGGLNPGGWEPTPPGGGWEPTPPGGWEPTPPGAGGDDPSIDSPGGGLLPGGPGGGLPGGSGGPGGSGSGSLPGGALPGGVFPGGGGGLGGIVGGGAGAAAIAASSKIAGFGSMGGLGGAGLGPGAGAGLKAGGGLLGNSAVGGVGGVGGAGGPGGIAGTGGVGGAGASGAGSSGAAGAGGRPGMGMMGGAGGADEEEKAKRSGLGGPIAPKLEDDEEAGPRAKGARAGSRDEPTD